MKRMLFNATHAEELRVAIVDGQRLVDMAAQKMAGEFFQNFNAALEQLYPAPVAATALPGFAPRGQKELIQCSEWKAGRSIACWMACRAGRA